MLAQDRRISCLNLCQRIIGVLAAIGILATEGFHGISAKRISILRRLLQQIKTRHYHQVYDLARTAFSYASLIRRVRRTAVSRNSGPMPATRSGWYWALFSP